MSSNSTPGSAPRGLLLVLSFANFAIGLGAFVIIGVMTPVSQGLGMSHAQAGLVMSVYAIFYAVLSPLGIAASGRLDRRTVLMIGMGAFVAAALLTAVAPNFAVLLVARALAAFGAGLVTPVAAAVAVALSSPERRGAALSAVFVGLTLAQAAGIPVGSFIGYTAGWRTTFWVVAAIAVVAMLAIWRQTPRIRTSVTTLASLGRALASLNLMVAILITASDVCAGWIVLTFFAPLLEESMGYGRNGVTALLVVYGAGAVLGNVAGGRLADRIGSARALIVVVVGLTAVLPLFSALPMATPLVVAVAFGAGVFGWGFMVPQQSRVVALAGDNANVALALNASAIYVGTAVGSGIASLIVDRSGTRFLGLAGGFAALLVLGHVALSMWLNRRTRRSEIAG